MRGIPGMVGDWQAASAGISILVLLFTGTLPGFCQRSVHASRVVTLLVSEANHSFISRSESAACATICILSPLSSAWWRPAILVALTSALVLTLYYCPVRQVRRREQQLRENSDLIFNAWYTTTPQGTGMGLAIRSSITEAHAGRLLATADEERGATPQFALPAEVRG